MAEARRLGAVAAGCAAAKPVDGAYRRHYEEWIAAGKCGEMHYLERYGDVRFDPRGLLPGARTVISLAFTYRQNDGYRHPVVAEYALGRDYHIVVRERLLRLADFIRDNFGASSRVCVDTAPLPERWWALRAGIGFRGLNGHLIVPGAGSRVFLGEVVTTLELEPDRPLEADCGLCGACVRACPGGAISPDGAFDAQRCHSYLSIEYRGELPEGTYLHGGYGCDECQRVCPHNRGELVPGLEEFQADEVMKSTTSDKIRQFSPGEWRKFVKNRALNRVKLPQMWRNLTN